ncbi:hypothetical protein Tco_1538075 [Tanacetum coccineum]
MPYLRFTKLIVKYVMSKNDKIPKRPLSFQHVIKLDTTLGNLKFANKGTIHPVFGMAFPALMLNGDIKASAEYSEYLKKATGGSTSVVKRGKGLLIVVEQLRIPKRRRSKTVTEEVYKSEQMDDLGDFKETEEEEVVPLVQKRSIGVVIGEKAHQESKVEEERIDNSEKLKGLETLYVAAQLKLDIKKALKASKDDFYIQKRSKGSSEGSDITPEFHDELVYKSSNKGARVNLEVLDESDSNSSSSSSDSEVTVEDISSDEDEVTEKDDNAKTADAKKDIKVQVADEQVAEKRVDGEVLSTDQGGNKPASKAHPDAHIAKALSQKPEATLISSSQTLSFTEFTIQFINEPAEVNLSKFLKDPVEPKVQSMVDVPVKQAKPAALRHPLIVTTVTIIPYTTTNEDEYIENRVYRLERQVNGMSKVNIQEVVDKSVEAHLKQIDLSKDVSDFRKIKQEKDKLYRMMEKVKAFNIHPVYKALFDALAVSLSIDEDDMDMLPDQPIQKKRRRGNHDKDPSPDADKDSKKKKRNDPDVSSSKKTKDRPPSSKCTTPSKSLKTNKVVQAEETIEDHNQEAGMHEELAVDEHRLKKDKLTKADLECPVFELLKGTCKRCIDLEYHLEQRYLAFFDKLDWTNPKGDRISQDLSKPLPLLGALGRLYILADYFFNKDLEYLRFRN